MYPSTTSTMSSSLPVDLESLPRLLQRIRSLGFDSIKYASYRTAAKLRFIQKETSVDLLDIWNVIEAFRENGLNGLDPPSSLTLPNLQLILYSLYSNLNKRLPPGGQVDPDMAVGQLLSWLIHAYHPQSEGGSIRVFSVKVALVTLCNGKLVDKFRYIFSLVSDSGSGICDMSRFQDYLDQVLALPGMVLESPAFPPSQDLAWTIFKGTSGCVLLNEFLETLLGEPGPLSLIWIPLIHLIRETENVNHPVPCSVCRCPTIQGLRYKCVKCSNFNLCQNCFWQGKTFEPHSNEHQVKEYSAPPKMGVGGLRNSFRKSLRCVPKGRKISRFPDQPQRPFNLNYSVPSSPLPFHSNGPVLENSPFHLEEIQGNHPYLNCPPTGSIVGSGSSCGGSSCSGSDEEHRLIAMYTARLASEAKYSPLFTYEPVQRGPPSHSNNFTLNLFSNTQTQREMIAKLEARNRDILREIGRLRTQQEFESESGDSLSVETVVMDELVTLRYHESDLEDKLTELKDSRNHLMGQIQGLMKLLQAQESSQGRGGGREVGPYGGSRGIRSAPSTPQHTTSRVTSFNSLGRGGELRPAFSSGDDEFPSFDSSGSSSIPTTHGRSDLLVAADSVTHAMSSLVRELNAEEESLYSPQWDKGETLRRMAEEEKYLEQLRNIRLSEGDSDELDLEGQVNELLGHGPHKYSPDQHQLTPDL